MPIVDHELQCTLDALNYSLYLRKLMKTLGSTLNEDCAESEQDCDISQLRT